MHSHAGLQEQQLLEAPLIFVDPQDAYANFRDIVLFLSDFSFTVPDEIMAVLKKGVPVKMDRKGEEKQDLNDVKFDAYLTNRRTLENPEIISIKPSEKIRLRVINGASASNFFIDTGSLKAEAIAVDGNPIQSFQGSLFELADAQRIDLLIQVPEEGVFPILALAEGTNMRTGLFLQTPKGKLVSLSQIGEKKVGALSNKQELSLRAQAPLPDRPIDRTLLVKLGGDMASYIWTINGCAWPNAIPLMVKEGERVEMVFINESIMSHPMHLHGHIFQIIEIDGISFSGALRDTVLVTPRSTVKVIFDANAPGIWPLHCHILYHQHAGMMTTLNYEGFPLPSFPGCENPIE